MRKSVAIALMVIWFIAGGIVTMLLPMRVTISMNPLGAYTDFTHKCRYVIADVTDDGLHIEITGEAHCRDRIHIDGVRIVAERKT